MDSPLRPEFDYYRAKQDELVKKYNGRFVVIKGQQVIGDYATEEAAVSETQKHHVLGTFLVQKVESGTDSYTQTFHSRVTFAH